MFDQKLESLGKTDYDIAVDTGVSFGKIAVLVLAVDLVFTLLTMSVMPALTAIDVNGKVINEIMAFVKYGEILAALVFIVLLAIFLASGVMAIKKTSGTISVLQAICISAVSGLITGAMAAIVLVVCMVLIAIYGMAQTGYITMFTTFKADVLIDLMKWALVVALLAVAAGVTYGGMAKKIKKLY